MATVSCLYPSEEMSVYGDTIRVCTFETPPEEWPPSKEWLCAPATRDFPLCVARDGIRVCYKHDGNYAEVALTALRTLGVSCQQEAGLLDLPAGALAGIVAGGILGPFLAGLAYKILCI